MREGEVFFLRAHRPGMNYDRCFPFANDIDVVFFYADDPDLEELTVDWKSTDMGIFTDEEDEEEVYAFTY